MRMCKSSKSFIKFYTLILLLLNSACKDVGVQPDKTFTLTAIDVNCTEAYLRLHVGAGITNREVMLRRDTVTLFTRTITTDEITVTDTNLLPNHNYIYYAQLLNVSTIQTVVTTMDTTSHDFTWQTYTLGDGTGSSDLQDVAIINDTLAYAVGQIYSGSIIPYCIAQWNGVTWNLLRLKFFPPGSIGDSLFAIGSSIFANSENDIWFAAGAVFHYDGLQWIPNYNALGAEGANKIWSDRFGHFWFVGNSGIIIYYDGKTWKKIESGTTLQFLDIYGATDPRTGEQQILAVCTQNYPGGKGIFSLKGDAATQLSSSPIGDEELFGVWFVPNREYYVVGDGIYKKHSLSNSVWKNKPLDPTRYATTKMRGNELNDAIVVGAFGECLHWNGVSWKSYREQTGLSNGSYGSVAVKGNLVIAVGGNNAQAVILIGRR